MHTKEENCDSSKATKNFPEKFSVFCFCEIKTTKCKYNKLGTVHGNEEKAKQTDIGNYQIT